MARQEYPDLQGDADFAHLNWGESATTSERRRAHTQSQRTASDQKQSGPMFTRRFDDPPLWLALVVFAGVVATISVGLFVFQADLSNLMGIAIAIVAIGVAYHRVNTGHSWVMLLPRMLSAGVSSIWRARAALVIFLLIGALIGAFIASGTVATLIYWGVSLISPAWFLPAGLILCCLMSVATGTAWGTVGTAGVVLIGIGHAMGIPLGLIGGMIVSGACFGDKMSPISDTTNLAAMSAGTDIYRHIRSMTYTTGPAFLLALVGFTVVGQGYSRHDLPRAQLDAITAALGSVYALSWITIIPLIVLLGMSIARVRAHYTMIVATLVAAVIAVTYQHLGFVDTLSAIWQGHAPTTGLASLDSLLGRGGVTSMWPTFQLSLLALILGGLLYRFGFMNAILAGILRGVRRTGSLIAAAIGAAVVGNLGMGEAYMSIILGGQLFQRAFDRAGVDRAVLSRCLEEGATLTTPLIPWTTAGIFFSTTMGIATLDYLPYAWLNLINPLIGVLFGYLGWGLLRHRRATVKL